MREVVAIMIRTLKHYVYFFNGQCMQKEWQQLLLITSYNRKGTKSSMAHSQSFTPPLVRDVFMQVSH